MVKQPEQKSGSSCLKIVFSKSTFSKINLLVIPSKRQTVWINNQGRPDLDPNCLQRLVGLNIHVLHEGKMLIHISLASFLWYLGKQRRLRSDAAGSGV